MHRRQYLTEFRRRQGILGAERAPDSGRCKQRSRAGTATQHRRMHLGWRRNPDRTGGNSHCQAPAIP
ncbi:hypothetical protein I551_1963 [Mycobacterium ulcerans str. Harvey]|uniref:Uncharacterized protein n=1 Tax=Mycobacterium ulcerans str. Harvey TaxID=1299332 RepID=A0ABN0R4C6_MYCUL|nr:hypothetical protein I551_1963 [Mycobacterium ulcerans str. Harvey]